MHLKFFVSFYSIITVKYTILKCMAQWIFKGYSYMFLNCDSYCQIAVYNLQFHHNECERCLHISGIFLPNWLGIKWYFNVYKWNWIVCKFSSLSICTWHTFLGLCPGCCVSGHPFLCWGVSAPWYGRTVACLTFHPLMASRVVSSLGLLQIELLWTFVSRSLCEPVFISLRHMPRSAIAGSYRSCLFTF